MKIRIACLFLFLLSFIRTVAQENLQISIEEPTLLLELFPDELHTIYIDGEREESFYLVLCGRTDTGDMQNGGFELLLNRTNERGDVDDDIATWRTDQCGIYIVDTGDLANITYRGDEGFHEAILFLAPFDFREDANHNISTITSEQLQLRLSFIERTETEVFVNLEYDSVCIIANLTESSSILNQGILDETEDIIEAVSGDAEIDIHILDDTPREEILLGTAQNNREHVREVSEPIIYEIRTVSDITDLYVSCIIDDVDYSPEATEES